MKKLFLTMLVALVAMTSCEKSNLNGSLSGETATLTISAEATSVTRALDDSHTGTLTYYVEIYLGNEETLKTYTETQLEDALYYDESQENDGIFNVELLTNQDYTVLAWADYGEGYYNTDNLANVTIVDTKYAINTTARDAFALSGEINLSSATTLEMSLVRPFGRVNVVSTDDIPTNFQPATVAISYETINTTYNILTGVAGTPTTENAFKVAATAVIDTENEDLDLSADYLLVSKGESATVTFTETYYNTYVGEITSYTFTNIPIQPNYQTNISGKILTDGGSIDIDVTDDWTGDIDCKIVSVATEDELKDALTNGDDFIIVTGDIEIDEAIEIPEGSDVTIDGSYFENLFGSAASRAASSDNNNYTFTMSGNAQFKIGAGSSLTINNVNLICEEGNTAYNGGMIYVTGAGASLTLNECQLEYGLQGTYSGGMKNGAIVVAETSGTDNVNVTLNSSTINLNSTYQTGVSFMATEQQSGSSLTLDNSLIYATTDNPNNATYTSGLSLGQIDGFKFEMINLSEIRNVYYGIYGYQYYHPTNFDFDITDSEISGYGMMIRGDKGTFDITNSTIIGRNHYSGNSDFATIVFTYDGADIFNSSPAATDIAMTIDNSTIKSYRSGSCDQWLIEVREDGNVGNTINIINGSTFIDEYAEGVTPMTYFIEYEDNGLKVTTDSSEELQGGAGVRLCREIILQGEGTEENPYEISQPYELAEFQSYSTGHFKITNDIDMTGMTYTVSSTYFTGVLDGGNHTISNLTIDSYGGSTYCYVGLVGCLDNDGIITNVVLDATCTIKLNYSLKFNYFYIGSFAGRSDGTITNCKSAMTFTTSLESTSDSYYGRIIEGGIAAYMYGSDALISGCEFSGTITKPIQAGSYTYKSGGGQIYVGGIAAYLTNVSDNSITGNTFSGTVTGNSGYTGAIYGYPSSSSADAGDNIITGTVNVE